MDLNFFILAGGFGIRALPLSSCRAKPAFPLLGVPLLTRMAGVLLERTGSESMGFVNMHHLPETVKKCLKPEWPIDLVVETELSGSRILTAALERPKWTHLLILNGDVFCDIPLRDLMLAAEKHDGVLVVREFSNEGPYRILEHRGSRFLKRGKIASEGLMYTGLCVLSRHVVARIVSKNFFDDLEREQLDISLLHYQGIWFDFGDPRSYFLSNMRFLDLMKYPETTLWSKGASVMTSPGELERTILWPHAVIHEGVRLQNCIVCDHVIPDTGTFWDGIWTRDGFFHF